jgi:hypothetical protein
MYSKRADLVRDAIHELAACGLVFRTGNRT